MRKPARKPTPRRAGRDLAGAFTLVELLVVVAIIAVLLGMVAPSMHKMLVPMRRGACGNNIREVVKACLTYANDGTMHRGALRKSLPALPVKTTNWGDMVNGNPGCLWLLVKYKFASRTSFKCPAAESAFNWEAPKDDANSFKYTKATNLSTLSYSYITMVRDDATAKVHARAMTFDNASPALVVLADKNPRTEFGTQSVFAALDLNHSGGSGADSADNAIITAIGQKRARNSTNHDREGQNIGRLNGGVKWITDPNDPEGNNIYTANNETNGKPLSIETEKKGIRGGPADPFVLP